jgi:hypothetical protein
MSDISLIENWEDYEPDETEKQMREREIRDRLRVARRKETIPAMVKRYKDYGVDI